MKRVLSMILLLMVMASVLTVAALAAGEPQIVVAEVQAAQGESITLDVALKNNPGINTFTLSIEYDHSRLELKSVTQAAALGGTFIYTAKTETVGWQVGSDTAYSGTAFTLNFEVLDDASLGNASVTITYKPGNICNFDEEDVDFTIVAGGITVKAAPHDCQWDDGVVTAEPTCEAKGVKTYTCGVCGDTYTEDIAMVPHDTELQNVKEATCSEEGYTGDEVCKNCGQTIKTGETTGKIAHDWDNGVVTAEPTCEAKGVKTFTCGVCGDTYAAEVAMVPHETELQNVKEATCSEEGYTGDEVCKNCGQTIKSGETIGKKPHDYASSVTVPSCVDKGYTTYVCAACGDTYEDDYVDALGHIGGEATCVDKAECSRCGKEYGEVNAANHAGTSELVGAKAPTCIEDGATGTGTCSACGEKLSESEVIPMLGHAMDDGTVTTEPTCEEKGVKTFRCTREGCDHQENEELDAIGHDWDEGVVTAEPTCEGEGKTTFTCKNDVAHTKGEPIAPLGHTWELTETIIAPLCEEDGEGIYTCANDETHTKNDVIEKTGHAWDEGMVTREPTTEQEGEKIYTCLNDPGHTWKETLDKLKPAGSGSSSSSGQESNVPNTGDETPVALYGLLAILCMAGTAVVLSLRKKHER